MDFGLKRHDFVELYFSREMKTSNFLQKFVLKQRENTHLVC